MTEAPATIETARAAKAEAKRRFAGRTDIVGIGVTRHGKGYAVKVNLGAAVDLASLPQTLNGVPVIFEVVGSIRKR
jgi:hypothetical protein